MIYPTYTAREAIRKEEKDKKHAILEIKKKSLKIYENCPTNNQGIITSSYCTKRTIDRNKKSNQPGF